MEIKKFKKTKNNIYEVEFDNNLKIMLYDDVIVKYNLLVNKRIDNAKFEEIVEFNDSLKAYYDVLKKLNSKLRCESELRDFLRKKEYDDTIIDSTIDKIKNEGYLNREVYIKSFINDAFMFNNYGPEKIKNSLNKLGFHDEEILPFLDLDFDSKVKKIIDKKLKSNTKYNALMFKIHIKNYLINNGYPKEMFDDYLDTIRIDNKDLLNKDAVILIKKYQKKYEKDKLLYFIKDKLYKKGYNREEIGEVLNELL